MVNLSLTSKRRERERERTRFGSFFSFVTELHNEKKREGNSVDRKTKQVVVVVVVVVLRAFPPSLD